MQGSARQDTHCFLLYHPIVLPISFVSRINPVYDSHDFVDPAISQPIEGLMSLSF